MRGINPIINGVTYWASIVPKNETNGRKPESVWSNEVEIGSITEVWID